MDMSPPLLYNLKRINCLLGGWLLAGMEISFTEIRKRDGRIVPFEKTKITQAIFAAARAVGGEDYSLAELISDEVVRFLAEQNLPGVIPAVEEIQDVVEKVLIERGHARTAKAYILYRASRTRIREARSELMDVVKDILLEERREAEGEKSRHSPAEKMHRIALAASRSYYLDNLLPPEIAAAHRGGSLHIHQLGYYSKTLDSLQIDLYPLLRSGYRSGEIILPRDFLGTLLRVVVILQHSRNDLYGETAIPAFDLVLGKLWRNGWKKMDKVELARALKAFLAYLRALPASGRYGALNCSIAIGLDTTAEGMAAARILLQELGDRTGQKSGPRLVFMLKMGINLDESDTGYPLYRLALEAALRGSNIVFSILDVPGHGSTADAGTCYFSSGQRVPGKGRGNIASVTINLPRLALSAAREELFFVELDRLLRLAVRQLLHRFEVLSVLQCRDLPFVMGKGLYLGSENISAEENIKASLVNGLMTLCFCGLREAVYALTKGQDGHKENAKRLQLRMLAHMEKRVKEFNEEYGLNFALCGATEEIKTKRFVQLDRRDFGLIEGVTHREFYSNGFMLFQEDEGLTYKLEWERELHRCCTAGFSSRAVLSPGLETGGAMDFIQKIGAAGIGFLQLSSGADLFIQ